MDYGLRLAGKDAGTGAPGQRDQGRLTAGTKRLREIITINGEWGWMTRFRCFHAHG